MNIVIDTNVFMSALIKEGLTREIIVNAKDRLLFPEFELDEIEKHKREILDKSGLSEEELKELLFNLLNYVKIIKTGEIVNYKNRAKEIIGEIDKMMLFSLQQHWLMML